MKILQSSLKKLKEKFNKWHDVLSVDSAPLQIFYTALIAILWLYSLLLVILAPEHNVLNLGIQVILLVYFVTASIVYFLKIDLTGNKKGPSVKAELVKQGLKPTVVLESVGLATVPPVVAPELEKKKVVRKPRRTKIELEKTKAIKEANIATVKKSSKKELN